MEILKNRPCQRMLHKGRIGPDREMRPLACFGGRKRGCSVQEFLLAQANERPPHQCAEGEHIRGICQHAQKRKNVLRLLSPHQRLACL